MTIGLILLGIVAILIFFGLFQRFFSFAKIKSWLAFIFVMMLVVGAIIPSININRFSINIGGFIVPLILTIIFFAVMQGEEVFKAIIAIIAVAAVAVGTRMLIEPINAGLILASSLIIGFVGGATAFLSGQSRLATLTAAFGGIILGDVITNTLNIFVLKTDAPFSVGSFGVFDSMILAAVFGAVLCQAVLAIKRLNSHRVIARTSLAMESADDKIITDESQSFAPCKNKQSDSKKQNKYNQDKDDDFFDEYIDS